MSLDRLQKLCGLPPETLQDILRSIVASGQVTVLTPSRRPPDPLAVRGCDQAEEPKVHLYDVSADPQQVERELVVGRVWEGIRAGIFYPAPSAMQCPTCPYRDECRRWAA